MVVVETQTDRQGSRNDSVSFVGIVDHLSTMFAALRCDSDVHTFKT